MATPKDVFASSGRRGSNAIASRLGIDSEIVTACLKGQKGFAFRITEDNPMLVSLTK